MTNNLKISIGIPAFNEEGNIARLLANILTQYESNFTIHEIIVISDGSTDTTVLSAKAINDHRIKIFDRSNRYGQAQRQNEILSIYSGDILILFNADIIINDLDFISKAIKPIINNKNIALVGVRISPLPAQNFFEKVINNSVIFKKEIYEQINSGNNLYLCHGRARVFSKKFADKMNFSESPGEDAYSYIQCIESGFEFYYQRDAEVFYRSPQNIKDHLKQSKRFINSRNKLDKKYKKNGESYYMIPFGLFIKKIIKYLYNTPILSISYLVIYSYARLSALWYHTSSLWEVSLSSKELK